MRLLILLQTLIFAVAFMAFGIVVFVMIGSDQRRFETEMQSIKAGQVQPETLTVVRKYANSGRHGSSWNHVVYRGPTKPEINELAKQSFYDAAKPGDHVTGYSFPDGYMIPQAVIIPGKGTQYVGWFFLGSGLLSGIVVIAFALLRAARPAPGTDFASISQLIKDRVDQVSDLER